MLRLSVGFFSLILAVSTNVVKAQYASDPGSVVDESLPDVPGAGSTAAAESAASSGTQSAASMEELVKQKQELEAQIAEQQAQLSHSTGYAGITTTPVPTEPGLDPAAEVGAMQQALTGNTGALEQMASDTVETNMESANSFTSGFIRAFFDNTPLLPGELTCLSNDAAGMVGDSTAVMQTLIKLILEGVAKEKPNPLELLSGGGEVMTIVSSVNNLVRNCVEGDALGVLKATKEHLMDVQYVKHRFMANGVDMMKVVADSIPSIETNNWGQAGGDFGTLFRKILLSPNNDQMQLVMPAGATAVEVPGEVFDGIIEGMFVPGSNVTITDTTNPNVNIFVDLYECVGKHANVFSELLNILYVGGTGAVNAIEQLQQGGGLAALGQPGGLQPGAAPANNVDMGAMMGQLSGMMGDMMMIATDCGINEESQAELKAALQDIKHMKVTPGIHGPGDVKTQTGNAAMKVEVGTQAFENGDYKTFGFNLGGVMRDLLLTVYKQKFTNAAGEYLPPPTRLLKRRLLTKKVVKV